MNQYLGDYFYNFILHVFQNTKEWEERTPILIWMLKIYLSPLLYHILVLSLTTELECYPYESSYCVYSILVSDVDIGLFWYEL